MRVTPSVAIARFLEAAGIEFFFGVVGHGNWALLDALTNTRIRGIRARAEDHAVHMADAYWRTKRQPPPAVVVATGGPGATNLIPALAEAYYSSVALIALVGAGPSQWFDRAGIGSRRPANSGTPTSRRWRPPWAPAACASTSGRTCARSSPRRFGVASRGLERPPF